MSVYNIVFSPTGAPKRLQMHSQDHLIVVYGNRAYDDTFVELQDVLTGAGFVCIAAVAATAEHSIMRQLPQVVLTLRMKRNTLFLEEL